MMTNQDKTTDPFAITAFVAGCVVTVYVTCGATGMLIAKHSSDYVAGPLWAIGTTIFVLTGSIGVPCLPLAVVAGIIALFRISKSRKTLKGGWLAVAGMVPAIVTVLLLVGFSR